MPSTRRKRRTFTLQERFTRAKQDTAVFEEWLRNLIVSLIAGAATYGGQYKLYGREEAVKGLWLSILVFVGVFILLPAFEFAWNFIRASRRILEDELESAEKAKCAAEERVTQLQSAKDVVGEWKELAARFREIAPDVRVEWQHGGMGLQDGEPKDDFWFAGGSYEKCRSLCRLAGAMLMRSPRTSASLSRRVAKETDDEDRWLKYLTERPEAVTNRSTSLPYKNHEGETEVVASGSLLKVGATSESACIDCYAREFSSCG